MHKISKNCVASKLKTLAERLLVLGVLVYETSQQIIGIIYLPLNSSTANLHSRNAFLMIKCFILSLTCLLIDKRIPQE